MSFGFTIIVGAIASSLIFNYCAGPFIWISGLWFVICLVGTFTEKRPRLKPVWFNVGVFVFALGSVEVYAGLTRAQRNYSTGYYKADDILGYAPRQDKVTSSSEYYGSDLIYNVTYTIAPDGLRQAPSAGGHRSDGCVLFFGDSFTFGEGVNDDETMPYRVGVSSNVAVYNFGFHGYGPHQMLAALEQGLVAKKLRACQPKAAVYQAIYDHTARAAGYAFWDRRGPYYKLLPDGSVTFAGHFDDMARPASLKRTLIDLFGKSFTYRRFFANRVISQADIDLFIGIVAASKETFMTDYPGSTFNVIYWDTEQNDNEAAMINGLRARGIRVHLISDILPAYHDDPAAYELSPHDNHPNALAHQLIADYVVTKILGP